MSSIRANSIFDRIHLCGCINAQSHDGTVCFKLFINLKVFINLLKGINNNNNNNNLLLGSSITESCLHRGPNTRYILYNETVKI